MRMRDWRLRNLPAACKPMGYFLAISFYLLFSVPGKFGFSFFIFFVSALVCFNLSLFLWQIFVLFSGNLSFRVLNFSQWFYSFSFTSNVFCTGHL